ncbi:MAG: terminase large subunit [Desulfobacteraceae bacterium]|nr:terminase large subunit [Desulfobacteraceae bacterium]
MQARTLPSPILIDPATQYALDVNENRIIAGPHVRDACKRHLADLESGSERGLTWDTEEVSRVIGFFKDVLTVEIEYTDEDGESISEAVPFVLEPSQAFIVGSLFGWKNKQGLRRFRRAYIEEAKGTGKSPLAAGIGHYMMGATRKIRAEVYSAATDKDQAAILFRDAVEMWRRSPSLYKRLVPSGQNPIWQLTMMSTQSFFKPISSEKKGKSGIRPYCALIDEVHEHPDNSVIEMLRAGTKGNRQALIFEITNSGFNRQSVCWSEHEYAIKIASGIEQNDAFFSYVCALDEGDDPFEDESCWIKANPTLGVTIQPEFIREQVNEAKGMPSKESMVRRLHFCQWVDSAVTWVGLARWLAIEHDLKWEDYQGEVCFGGLDLSYTADLSACAWVFPTGPESFDAFVDFWKPRSGLQEAVKRDKAPYDMWAKNGYLRITEGVVIKLAPLAQRMAEVSDHVQLQGIAYDHYRHKELANEMLDLGIELPMIEHPQGFRRVGKLNSSGSWEVPTGDDGKPIENPLWMPSSVQELENAIVEERIRVCLNPVLRWNASSVVIRQDPAGTDNKIFDKSKSISRIDGIVALAMAVGLAKSSIKTDNTKSFWETLDPNEN